MNTKLFSRLSMVLVLGFVLVIESFAAAPPGWQWSTHAENCPTTYNNGATSCPTGQYYTGSTNACQLADTINGWIDAHNSQTQRNTSSGVIRNYSNKAGCNGSGYYANSASTYCESNSSWIVCSNNVIQSMSVNSPGFCQAIVSADACPSGTFYTGGSNGWNKCNGVVPPSSCTASNANFLGKYNSSNSLSVLTGIYEDASRNVGIGTTSPVTPLHINDATNNDSAQISFSYDADVLTHSIGRNSTTGLLEFDAKTNNNGFEFSSSAPDTAGNFSISNMNLCLGEDCIAAWDEASGGKWEDAATAGDIYYNAGKVGIGTDTPTGLFQLGAGNFATTNAGYKEFHAGGFGVLFRDARDSYITSNLQYTAAGWVNKYSGFQPLMLSMDLGEFMFYTGTGTTAQGAAGLNARLTIKNDGKVGIGTTSPVGMLNISENGASSGAWVGNAPTTFITNGGTSNSYYALGISNANGPTFAVTNAGNVGIGTTNPTAKLSFPSATDEVGGIRFGTDTVIYRRAIGEIFIESSLHTNAVRTNSVQSPDNFFWIGEDGAYIEEKVGIGTSSPVAKLHVQHSGNNDTSFFPAIQVGPSTSGASEWQIGTQGYNDLVIRKSSGTPVENILFLENTNGNVGIGTASPSDKLTVNGHAAVLNGNQLRAYTTGGSLRGMIYATDSSPHLNIRTSGGEDIAFRDGGTSGDISMFIEGSNNYVGIGTEVPSDPLTVNGSSNLGGTIRQGAQVAKPLAYWSAAGSTTGAVVLKLPGNSGNYGMVHMVIDVYEYNGNSATTYIVGGHNWNGAWYNTSVRTLGVSTKPVRLAFKDGQYAVVIGDASSSWTYGHVLLRSIHNAGFYAGTMDLSGPYTISQFGSDSYTWVSSDLNDPYVTASTVATSVGSTDLNMNGNNIIGVGALTLNNGFSLVQGNSSYGRLGNWLDVGQYGLYSTTLNNAHFKPNAESDYGAWRTIGSRNGWGGFNYNGSSTLMMHDSYMGFYNDTNNEWMAECALNSYCRLYHNGVSKLETTASGVMIDSNLGINVAPTSDGYRLNMGGSVHMNNNQINYLNQVHFNDGVRITDEGNNQFLRYRWDNTGVGGMRFYDGDDQQQGMIYGSGDGNNFGLLDADGDWAVRITRDNYARLYVSGTERLRADTAGAVVYGRLNVGGDIYTDDRATPRLILDSLSSGASDVEQAATISLGESGTGSASLHLAYHGNGYGYIGMGALGSDNLPDYWAMRMHYQSKNVNFDGSIDVNNDICLSGDCRSSWSSLSDNMGNHTATQDLLMGTHNLRWSQIALNLSAAPRTLTSPNSIKLFDSYNDGGPSAYGTVLDIYGRSGHQNDQLYFGNDGTIYHRDAFYGETSFSGWRSIWSSGNDGAGSGLDADLLDGYNLTDASTVNTVVRRDASGDINARLFRSEYDSTNSNIGYIMTQVDTASDNYMRPSTPAQLAAALTPHLSGGDNLGTHVASTNLNMGNYNINNITNLNITSGTDSGIQFWGGGTNYTITMGNDQQDQGTVTDYSMHFNMGSTAGRGFTFGSSPTGVAASINALTGAIDSDGNVSAYGFQGNANVGGTGSASWHPSGIYSAGPNWLYGTTYMNGSISGVDEIYNNGWFRNQNVNEGLYNTATGKHFYSGDTSYWVMDSTNGLQMRSGHEGTVTGYLYWDGTAGSNNIGLLSPDGSWGLRLTNGDAEFYHPVLAADMRSSIYYDRDNTSFYLNPASVSYLNDVRSTIYYDRDDTNYYADPASTTRLNVLNVQSITRDGSYPSFPGGIYVNAGTAYFSNEIQVRGGLKNDSTGGGGRVQIRDDLEFTNYGIGVVGLYSATRYQNLFSMGSSYTPAEDGTSLSNMYGVAWTHSNIGGESIAGLGHQALFVSAGDTRSAVGDGVWTKYDVTGNRFVDQNNTGYYVDPASTNRLNHVVANTFEPYGVGANSGVTGGSYRFGYQEPGAWTSPFPDLVIGYHTGMKMGAYPSYGGIRFYNDHPSSSSTEIFSIGNGDNNIRTPYAIYAAAFNYNSDERLKDNIVTIGSSLDKILALRGVEFTWKESGEESIGFIAQEVEEVFPELVQEDINTGYKTVQYGNLVAPMVEAMKELNAKLEAQQAEIDELKAQLAN